MAADAVSGPAKSRLTGLERSKGGKVPSYEGKKMGLTWGTENSSSLMTWCSDRLEFHMPIMEAPLKETASPIVPPKRPTVGNHIL